MKAIKYLFILPALIALICSACTSDNTTTETTNNITVSGDNDIDAISAKIGEQPENGDLYAMRAEMYFNKNSYDQAIVDMTHALTIDSTNLGYHHLLTDIYLDYFRSRLALQTMERAIAIAPDHIPSLLKTSEIQLFLKQNQSSLSTIDKILKIDPQNALAYFFMGKNFEEMGEINRAINSFQEASEIDPEMLDAWIKLGQLHASIDGNLANQLFDNAIEVDSTNTIALNAKAEYMWDQGNRQSALELYQKAIQKAPMDEKSYYNAGLVYLEMDSISQAYNHFNIAIENSPLYVAAYYHRAYAAELLGKIENAKRDYQHTLRLAPSYTKAQEALNRLQ